MSESDDFRRQNLTSTDVILTSIVDSHAVRVNSRTSQVRFAKLKFLFITVEIEEIGTH